MKANKAPEKIWMSDDTEAIWVTNPYSTRFIEYTRTDAFIKKACDWLRTHSEADYLELITPYNYCGAGKLNKKKMVEDFEKYIRGE